jgi:hypothetical protein
MGMEIIFSRLRTEFWLEIGKDWHSAVANGVDIVLPQSGLVLLLYAW